MDERKKKALHGGAAYEVEAWRYQDEQNSFYKEYQYKKVKIQYFGGEEEVVNSESEEVLIRQYTCEWNLPYTLILLDIQEDMTLEESLPLKD